MPLDNSIDPFNKIKWKRNLLDTPTFSIDSKDSFALTSEAIIKKLQDAQTETELETLMIQKLNLCNNVFDFSIKKKFKKKKFKQELLSEILSYFVLSKTPLSSAIFPHLTTMIGKNLFRNLKQLPFYNDTFEKHYAFDLQRPHLILIYEMFLKVLEMPGFSYQKMRMQINESFIFKLMDLFESQDKMEKALVKRVIYKIYQIFIYLRRVIRRKIYDNCWLYYFLDRYNTGLPAILELFSSLIPGFCLPLSKEHLVVFNDVLLNLHSCHYFHDYYKPFLDCLYEYLLKDHSLFQNLVKSIIHFWPKNNSEKEILFLNELNDLLMDIGPYELLCVKDILYKKICKCLVTEKYTVCSAALDLITNPRLCYLMKLHYKTTMPLLAKTLKEALNKPSQRYNPFLESFQTLSVSISKLVKDMKLEDPDKKEDEKKQDKQIEFSKRWASIKLKKMTYKPETMAIRSEVIDTKFEDLIILKTDEQTPFTMKEGDERFNKEYMKRVLLLALKDEWLEKKRKKPDETGDLEIQFEKGKENLDLDPCHFIESDANEKNDVTMAMIWEKKDREEEEDLEKEKIKLKDEEETEEPFLDAATDDSSPDVFDVGFSVTSGKKEKSSKTDILESVGLPSLKLDKDKTFDEEVELDQEADKLYASLLAMRNELLKLRGKRIEQGQISKDGEDEKAILTAIKKKSRVFTKVKNVKFLNLFYPAPIYVERPNWEPNEDEEEEVEEEEEEEIEEEEEEEEEVKEVLYKNAYFYNFNFEANYPNFEINMVPSEIIREVSEEG